MSCRPVLVDLPKDRGPMMDHSVAPIEQRAARARNLTGKGQLRPRQETDRRIHIVRCREPPGASAKIAGSQLVANLRGPRFDVVKAEVTHFVELPYWEKPLSQLKLTLFSVLLHQPSGVELVRSESFDRLVEKINASLRIAGEHHE
jgi:phage terminase large subunit-like protein